MTPADLIRHYGTQTKAGEAVGVSQATISTWNANGEIPILRQMQIERLTGGALAADADALRAYGLVA